MTKLILIGSVLAGLGTSAGCGSSSGDAKQTTDPACVDPTGPNCNITVDDRSFVHWAGPLTDAVSGGPSTAVVEVTPGKVCMSGVVDAGPNRLGWGVFLTLSLLDGQPVTGRTVSPFDATAHGITQLRFTVDNPPATGLLPEMAQLSSADCMVIPDCVSTFDRSAAIIESGSVTMALADFAIPDADHPGATLDPTLLTGLHFSVAAPPSGALNYAFCIHDLAFLDAAGNAVSR